MPGFFDKLFGLFTRRYASIREAILTRYAFGHQSSVRSNMRHEFAFGVNLSSAMAEMVDIRHESEFTVDLVQVSSFASNMRHGHQIKKRD